MLRRLATPILALTLASTLAGTSSALAASHSIAAKGTQRTQAGLIAAVNGFGYALVHGPNSAINGAATPALLAGAPAHQIINLLGPAGYPPQNPPSSYTFQVTAYTGSAGAATLQLAWGAQSMTERTSWVYTATGWKLSAMRYAGTNANRESLLTANYAFMHDLQQASPSLNRYATATLLRHARYGQLISFYGFQNPFRSASVSINWLAGGTARVTQRFDFGGKTIAVRIVTWVYTANGWKINGVAGPGRG